MQCAAAECDRLIFLASSCPSPNASYSGNYVWARGQQTRPAASHSDNNLLDFAMQLPHLRKYKNDLRLCAVTVPRWEMLEQCFRSPLPGFWRDQLAAKRLDRQGRFQLAETAGLIDEHVAGLLTVPLWQDGVPKGGA
jgi:hypothetical protein